MFCVTTVDRSTAVPPTLRTVPARMGLPMWERVPSRDVLCQDSRSEHGGSSHVEDSPPQPVHWVMKAVMTRDTLANTDFRAISKP